MQAYKKKLNQQTLIEKIYNDPNYKTFVNSLLRLDKDIQKLVTNKTQQTIVKQSPYAERLLFVMMNSMSYFLKQKPRDKTEARIKELLMLKEDRSVDSFNEWIYSINLGVRDLRSRLTQTLTIKNNKQKSSQVIALELKIIKTLDDYIKILQNPLFRSYKEMLVEAINQDKSLRSKLDVKFQSKTEQKGFTKKLTPDEVLQQKWGAKSCRSLLN